MRHVRLVLQLTMHALPIHTGATYGDEDFHGTHTCGSAVGARLAAAPGPGGGPVSSTVPDLASGAAPLARLSILDMGDQFGNLFVPSDVNQGLLAVSPGTCPSPLQDAAPAGCC